MDLALSQRIMTLDLGARRPPIKGQPERAANGGGGGSATRTQSIAGPLNEPVMFVRFFHEDALESADPT